MNLTFRKISTDAELKELSLLAHRIWNDYYPSIIGQKQVDYMLERMYSIESLKEQIYNKKNVFVCAFYRDEMVGFISYSKTGEFDYIIHKLYVNTKMQRKGIGRELISHVFEYIKYKTVRLTVNRQNFKAINFYFRMGFTIEEVKDIDIGNGFFMNDFVMLLVNTYNDQLS